MASLCGSAGSLALLASWIGDEGGFSGFWGQIGLGTGPSADWVGLDKTDCQTGTGTTTWTMMFMTLALTFQLWPELLQPSPTPSRALAARAKLNFASLNLGNVGATWHPISRPSLKYWCEIKQDQVCETSMRACVVALALITPMQRLQAAGTWTCMQ